MARSGIERSPSPPTRRVIEIVSLLNAEREPATVAGMAERLGIARATATAVLAELEAAGWAVRVPQRGYRIGPAFLALGAALLPGRVDDIFTELTECTGCGATLSLIEPEHLTVLYVRHGPDRVVPGIPVGHRIPLRFPAGAAVMPWRVAAERNTWIATADDSEKRTASGLLTLARERGAALFRPRADDAGLVDLLADLLSAAGTELLQPRLHTRALRKLAVLTARPFTAAELDSDTDLPLSYLAAPVFDAGGTAAYEVQLGPLRATTTRAERDDYVTATLDAAREVTAALATG